MSAITFPAAFDRRRRYAFVEAANARETVLKVFGEFADFRNQEKVAPAGLMGGDFMTWLWGLRTPERKRFVCFQQDEGSKCDYYTTVLREFCRRRFRRWGVLRDNSLVLSDGTIFPISELEIIWTNPRRKRLGDQGGYDPRGQWLAAVMWIRRARDAEPDPVIARTEYAFSREQCEQMAVACLAGAIVAEESDLATVLNAPEFEEVRNRDDLRAMLDRYLLGLPGSSVPQKPPADKEPKRSQ